MNSSFFILILSENLTLSKLIAKVADEMPYPTMVDRSIFIDLFEMPLENNEVNILFIDLEGRVNNAEKLYRQVREHNVLVPIIFIVSKHDTIDFAYLTADGNVNILVREDIAESVIGFAIRSLRQMKKSSEAKQNAQIELAENESLLKQSQQLAKLGHWKFFAKTKKDIWSEETFRIYGFNPKKDIPTEELFYSIIHPEDFEYFKSETNKFVESKKPYHLTYRLLTPDGTVKYVQNFTRPNFDSHGQLESFTGTVQDVTEYKLSELRISEAQERLMRVVENLPSGAVLVENGELTLNRAAERITGYKREELKTLEDWFQKLYGKNHDVVKMIYENDRNKSFPSKQITPITRKDGIQVEIEFAGVELSGTEVWLINDLSDVKYQQELFKGLFEHSSDGMLLMEGYKIVDCNQQVVKLLKAKNKNYIVGKEPIELTFETHPDGKTSEQKRLEIDKELASNDNSVSVWNHKALDGTLIPIRVTIKRITVRNKLYKLVVWHDLSLEFEQKKKETEKERLVNKLINKQQDLIALFDLESNSIIYSNDQIQSLLGYSVNEAVNLGSSIRAVLHSGNSNMSKNELTNLISKLNATNSYTTILNLKHKNKSIVSCLVKLSVFDRDQSDKVNQILISAFEVPDILQKTNFQGNFETDGRYANNILGMLPDTVFVYDLQKQANVFSNNEITALLGYSPDDFLEMGNELDSKILYSEDFDILKEYYENVAKLKDGEILEVAYRMVHKNGSILNFLVKVVVFKRDEKNVPIQTLGVVRDITEKIKNEKELEERTAFFKALNESAAVGIFFTDLEGKCNYANSYFVSMCGLKEQDFLGNGWQQAIISDDKDRVKSIWQSSIEQNKPINIRTSFQNQDGNTLQVNIRTTEMLSEGKFIGYIATVENMTELSKVTLDLDQNLNRIETILNNAGFSVMSIGRDYCFRSFNKENELLIKRFFNVDIKLGMNIFENSICLVDKSVAVEYFKRAFNGELISTIENCENLNNAIMEITYCPVITVDGRVEEVAVMAKDITKSKNLEKLSKYHESNFQELFNNSPDAIFVEDYDGRILAINSIAAKMQNVIESEMVGHNIMEFTPERLEAKVADNFQRMVKGEIDTLESFMWRKNMEPLPVEIKCNRIKYGEIPALLLHVRSIEARKDAELEIKNLTKVIEETNDYIGMVYPDGKGAYRNKAYRELTGYKDNEQFSIADTYPPEVLEKLQNEVQPILIEKGFWQGETAILDKNGNQIPCSQVLIAHKNDQGEVIFYSTILRDISESKKVQEGLMKAKEIAENEVKAKEMFLANISHEVRTPMNGIVGLTEVLIQTTTDEGHQEMLKAIRTSSDNLITILNDILDLAKITAGKMTFEKHPIKLKELVQNSIKLFEGKANEKNLSLKFAIDSRLSNNFLGDDLKLAQVLNNLIGNAIKFTPSGRIDILISKISQTKDGTTIQFSVKDTGIGVPPDKIDVIFESFSQASNDTSRKFGGTGLGLTISKQYVELQGGKIWVESNLGHGSTFSFQLHLETPAEEMELNESLKLATKDEFSYDFLGAKVLVAEDNTVNQLLLKHILEKLNFNIEIAFTGEDVLAKVENNDYDIILMDMQMPEMDGYVATERIRKYDSQIKAELPIIALTANSGIENASKCFEAGVNEYISKPFKQKDLVEKLMKFLPYVLR